MPPKHKIPVTTRLLLLAVFIAGLSIGWLSHMWLQPGLNIPATSITANGDHTTVQTRRAPKSSGQPPQSAFQTNSGVNSQTANAPGSLTENTPPDSRIASAISSTGLSIFEAFESLLKDRLYREAISLYQEQDNQSSLIAPQLKTSLLSHLELLTRARRYDEFFALIDQYLTVYYDDVEVLLLLADFNHANGRYLEVVDIYLLAKTYAYNDPDHQKVLNRFNAFVEEIDRWYTNQQNWLSLMSLYSHINTSGLMTSRYQFRQALAYLRSGDENFAIAQFNELLGDSVVGESAALALGNLQGYATAPRSDNQSIDDRSESIALQRVGNQYAVALGNNRTENINLLIDTGASMTAMSSASFNAFGISADAEAQDRRVFRTAGGVVMGTVYVVPELQLGPFQLRNTRIAVIDFETPREIDGLLGMNILGQFRFQIDQENSRLNLSEK